MSPAHGRPEHSSDPAPVASLVDRRDTASVEQVAAHLYACDQAFVPPLSGRVDLQEYSLKIVQLAVRYEAWHGGDLVGLVAAYVDSAAGSAFITNVSVLPDMQARGIAASLLDQCSQHIRGLGITVLALEVAQTNSAALGLYRKLGFTPPAANSCGCSTTTLTRVL